MKTILSYIKKFFTGEHIDNQCEEFINSYKPSNPEEVDRLRREFWRRMLHGRYL